MQLAEPYCVEADFVAELDLGENVAIALLLRRAGRAGQLVEKPEAHASSRGPIWLRPGLAWRTFGEQGRAIRPLDPHQSVATLAQLSPRDCGRCCENLSPDAR